MCSSKPQEPKIIQQPPVSFQYVPTPTPVNKQRVTAAAIEEEGMSPKTGSTLGAGGAKMGSDR